MNKTHAFALAATAHQAPPLTLLAMEPLRALFDFFAGKLDSQPERVGDGHAVIVFPGLGGAPFTTAHLRNFLDESGYDARCWGRGINRGHEGVFDDWMAGLVADTVRAYQDSGRRVSLIGWSLGGVFVREIAKLAPNAVRSVVTLGSPFGGLGRGATNAESLYRVLSGDKSQMTPALQARLRQTPPVPTTALYSKTDGVVAWQDCVERTSRHSESIEVYASHLGMVTHPQVLRIVADRLAQPEGAWQPFMRASRPSRSTRSAAPADRSRSGTTQTA